MGGAARVYVRTVAAAHLQILIAQVLRPLHVGVCIDGTRNGSDTAAGKT
jgi:hypothetical protein